MSAVIAILIVNDIESNILGNINSFCWLCNPLYINIAIDVINGNNEIKISLVVQELYDVKFLPIKKVSMFSTLSGNSNF